MEVAPIKKSAKSERERQVLLGLVDFYLRTGRPVGSHTLKESGFEDLSSATIRNYFAHLDEEGYLEQLHASGGRIPTDKALRLYVNTFKDDPILPAHLAAVLEPLKNWESREIGTYLQKAAEILSGATGCAVALSAPRFDHDSILDLKVVGIDHHRCLCVLITDFGQVRTEILTTDQKLSTFAAKRIEAYCQSRLTGIPHQDPIQPEEERLARQFYNEVMVRYLVGYSHFIEDELYRTGFATLLHYPEFNEPSSLAKGLSLFENTSQLRRLLKESVAHQKLCVWIGSEIDSSCALLAAPYFLHQHAAGAVALLGPTRLPYRELFGILQTVSALISDTLTKALYKFKITYREPHAKAAALHVADARLLLENKRHERQ